MRSAGTHQVLHGWTALDHAHEAPFLTFVQVARGLTFTGSTLELLELAPVTLCVGPTPEGFLSHITTGAFLDLWWAADDSSVGGSQRRGVIALVDPDSRPLHDTPVHLSRPRIHGSGPRYDSSLVEGILPASSGSCALFIHPATTATPTRGGAVVTDEDAALGSAADPTIHLPGPRKRSTPATDRTRSKSHSCRPRGRGSFRCWPICAA